MVSPPDVFDTVSARGHPRPVPYHLWTKVAARSSGTNCYLGPGPQAPYGTLTRVAPCWYYPLLDEVICPTVAPPPLWSSRTRAVDPKVLTSSPRVFTGPAH